MSKKARGDKMAKFSKADIPLTNLTLKNCDPVMLFSIILVKSKDHVLTAKDTCEDEDYDPSNPPKERLFPMFGKTSTSSFEALLPLVVNRTVEMFYPSYYDQMCNKARKLVKMEKRCDLSVYVKEATKSFPTLLKLLNEFELFADEHDNCNLDVCSWYCNTSSIVAADLDTHIMNINTKLKNMQKTMERDLKRYLKNVGKSDILTEDSYPKSVKFICDCVRIAESQTNDNIGRVYSYFSLVASDLERKQNSFWIKGFEGCPTISVWPI